MSPCPSQDLLLLAAGPYRTVVPSFGQHGTPRSESESGGSRTHRPQVPRYEITQRLGEGARGSSTRSDIWN
jgi:hypothetical protein